MQPSYPTHWQISGDHRPASQMAAWAVTEPVALDLAPPRPAVGVMREPLHGLQVQELNSAEVFHRYFGDLAN